MNLYPWLLRHDAIAILLLYFSLRFNHPDGNQCVLYVE